MAMNNRPKRRAALAAGILTGVLAPLGSSTSASSASACAQADSRPASFVAPAFLNAGRGPWFIIATDLNRDGRHDLAVANSGGGPGVSLLINQTPRGSMRAAFTSPVGLTGSGLSQQALAAADFNRDGRPDLAVGNFFSTDRVRLVDAGIDFFANRTPQGAATPRLVKAATIPAGTAPEGFAVGDFNADGRPDLAFSDYGVLGLANTSDVSIVLNRTVPGSDAFRFSARMSLPVGIGPIGVSATDVNRDGLTDLVVANNFSFSASVLLNRTPAGARQVSFRAPVDFAVGSPLIGPETLTTGDLNRDARPDVVTPNFLSDGLGSMSVLINRTRLGTSTPAMSEESRYRAGIGPQHAAIGDLNGDAVPDIAVANYGVVGGMGSGVSVFTNLTDCGELVPHLSAARSLSAGAAPTALVERDFNRDGRRDIAVSNHMSLGPSGVAVFLNSTTSTR